MSPEEHPFQPRDLLRDLSERLAEFERRSMEGQTARALLATAPDAQVSVAALHVVSRAVRSGHAPRLPAARVNEWRGVWEEAERYFRDALNRLLFAYALHEFDRAATARDYYFECHAFRWPSPWERAPHAAAERLAEALDVEPNDEIHRLARLSFPESAADASIPARALLEACERLVPGGEVPAFYRLLLETLEKGDGIRDRWTRFLEAASGRDTIAGVLFVCSLLHGARGRHGQALDALNDALLLRPDAWPLHLERACVWLTLEETSEAVRSLGALKTMNEGAVFAGVGLRECLIAARERWKIALSGGAGVAFLSFAPRFLRNVLEEVVNP